MVRLAFHLASIALLACGPIGFAEGASAQSLLSAAQFRDAEIAHIRAAAPAAQITVRDELGVTVTVPDRPDIASYQMNLDRAYREYQSDPAEIDSLLDRWTRVMLDQSDQIHGRDRLVPIVRSQVRVRASEELVAVGQKPAHLIVRPFAGDLDEVLAFDSADAIGYVTDLDLHDLNLTVDEAWSVASENLSVRMGPVQTEPIGPRGLLLVTGGNGLAPSNLLNQDFCTGPYGGDLIFVSDRSAYVVADHTPGAFQMLREFATREYQSGESESAVVLVCQDGRLVQSRTSFHGRF